MSSKYMTPIQITEPKILAVEGKDEKHFFEALINNLNLSNIQILDIAGKQNFKYRLEVVAISPMFFQVISLGVVRDADTDPIGAFQSVCAALRRARLPVPTTAWQFCAGTPRVIVMIMPDGTSPGMLEDLCLRSVGQQTTMRCVNQYFTCLNSQGINPHSTLALSKAKVQTYLASKRETGTPLGIAALKGYWPLGNPSFAQVTNVLHSL